MAEGSPASLEVLVRQAQRRLSVRRLPTAIERYFEISLYLLVATGFATLASTGRLDTPAILLVTAALLLRGYLLLRNMQFAIPERWTSRFTLGYVLFYAVDYYLLSGAFIPATLHLVLFSTVVKLFSAQRDRDHLYLAVLAFLAVLAAAILTVDSLFLGVFSIFLLLAVTTFASMEMRRSSRAAVVHAREGGIRNRRMAVALSGAGIAMLAAVLVLATGIFFVLPRLSAGYLSSFAPRSDFVSGFSDNIQLGQIGQIKQSDAVVMHVQIDGDHGDAADLKWRGLALANFDGRRWFNFSGAAKVHSSTSGQFDLTADQESAGNLSENVRSDNYRVLSYRITMEPLGTNVLFLAPVATAISSEFRHIGVDEAGAVFNLDRRHLTQSYRATSLVQVADLTRLRASGEPTPARIGITYRQLPGLDSRIRALTEQITAGAATDYDKAVAIEQYLGRHYRYTLDMGYRTPADPLAYFLFERKEGHCEYFASAMAIMLRTVGVPSRVVNGFRGSEYNDLTSSYIVRARNAHSWVEAYLGGQWVSFDPTPPDPRASGSRWQRFLLYVDAAREFWREWVVLYDFERQHTLTTAAVAESQGLFARASRRLRLAYDALLRGARGVMEGTVDAPKTWGANGAAAIMVVLLLINLPRLLRMLQRRRLAQNPQRAPQAAASIWYARLTARLARRGWRKSPSQTPQEFASTISDPVLAAPVTQFTAHYERARFGDSADDAACLPALFERIRALG